MKTLAPTLRKQLERVVVDARDVAEAGAQAALESLAVTHREPHAHMNSAERALRRRLRAHGRQLGDRRDARSGVQAIDRLTHECAYEHWHGMLFARFLAENELLIEPEAQIPVTLNECEDLAKDEGIDKWMLAARFAHRMLPQVFRPDHPVFAVQFAREHQLELEELIDGLPTEVFTATDSLGWVYQFWQSKKKNEVNSSGGKIGANELPAVTQLFTEPYMVSFLLDNSLGAWWAARRLSAADLNNADSENELRRKAAIRGVPLDYLRFARSEESADDGGWHLAAGAFERWPENLAELKVLDPCCGSGHFLVAALSMLVPMRMEAEGLSTHEAIDAALRDNLHGLELDTRCVELAAFSLALAAWTWPGAEGYRPLPQLNVACSGLAPNTTKERWATLAEQAAAAGGLPAERDLLGTDDSLLSAPLRASLESLYDLFQHAPERGSLINPRALKTDMLQSSYDSVQTLFASILKHEQTTDEQTERAVIARGMANAAELLVGRYHLVITNVPYLARSKQSQGIKDHCQTRYPASKNDLATVFLERCLELCAKGGTASLVLPQNWLFLTRYRKLREKLLKAETWHLLARLGEGGFESSAAAGAFVSLLCVSHCNHSVPHDETAINTTHGLDVSDFPTARDKAAQLRKAEIKSDKQNRQLDNPDAVISFDTQSEHEPLSNYSYCYQGASSLDIKRFRQYFWEVRLSDSWNFHMGTPTGDGAFSGLKWLSYSRQDGGAMHEMAMRMKEEGFLGGWLSGNKTWAKKGVACSCMRELPATLYYGPVYDHMASVILPNDERCLPAIWAFCSSREFNREVRKINQKVQVANATLVKVPFDYTHWSNIAAKQYPNGLPQPYSDDPTQWIFHGHPGGSVVWDRKEKRTVHGPLRTDANVLQVATARLLGYRWPAEKNPAMELADEQRKWAWRCEALLDHADDDGIVCIPSVRGEPSAEERLLDLLAHSFGNAWSNETITRLLAETGAGNLDNWLRNHFFDRHSKLFHHRPFIWHIWDGRAHDGFHALVNYHTLAAGEGKGRQCLESLAYSYLGDWITRQRDGVTSGKSGAEDRLAAALELQKRLKLILEGEPPFDIFVRWKPIEEQPIGWNPDINDGVRLNIRPFMADDIPGGRKGAGILRVKPNIHWRKDRGKEPSRDQQRFPWFWSCTGNGATSERTDFLGGAEFDGNRWNDLHYTKAAKHAARELRPLTEAGTPKTEGRDRGPHHLPAPALNADRKHAK